MVGRTIENEYPDRPHCVGEPLMKVEHLCTRKLKDISFTLNRGEILGLVGLVGSGRTEIVRAIYGADKVKRKRIFINEKEVNINSPQDGKKYGMAFIPEDRKTQGLLLRFSVASNISMASLGKLSHKGLLSLTQEKIIAEKNISELAIKTPSTNSIVNSLSGGNQQKCIIGRWIETDPQIFIMDEPTRGIDVGAKYEIYLLMKKAVENGSSIILISSELPEVLNMSNRVIVIADGEITGEFYPEKSSAQEIMDRAIN